LEVVEKQQEEYQQLRRLLLETQREMDAMLQHLIMVEGLEDLFME
jgi:hypothetical protein